MTDSSQSQSALYHMTVSTRVLHVLSALRLQQEVWEAQNSSGCQCFGLAWWREHHSRGKSSVRVQLPLAAAAALFLSSGVEADHHTSAAQVWETPGQVRVQALAGDSHTGQAGLLPGQLRDSVGEWGRDATCVDWMTVRWLMRLNPAPMGALSPAVPKLKRLQSRVLSSSRCPAASRASTWARVQGFYRQDHSTTPDSATDPQGPGPAAGAPQHDLIASPSRAHPPISVSWSEPVHASS